MTYSKSLLPPRRDRQASSACNGELGMCYPGQRCFSKKYGYVYFKT